MLNRRLLLALTAGLSLAAVAASIPAHAAGERVKAVASFSILGDLVREVGGDRVEVATLVGANGDAHVYEPTPADARKLGEAQLLFENGLAFESWLPRLLRASGFAGTRVVVSEGITPRAFRGEDDGHDHADGHGGGHADHRHGVEDPHAWQNVANAVIYVKNIAAALEKADPDHAAAYRERATAYAARLAALDAKLKARFGAIPEARRKVVTTHDAFGYFGSAYGIAFLGPRGVSTESEASASDVARIIDQIREDGITAVFLENITSPKLTEQIASATGVKVGGRLYSDALAAPGEPASTYIGLVESNAARLIEALGGTP